MSSGVISCGHGTTFLTVEGVCGYCAPSKRVTARTAFEQLQVQLARAHDVFGMYEDATYTIEATRFDIYSLYMDMPAREVCSADVHLPIEERPLLGCKIALQDKNWPLCARIVVTLPDGERHDNFVFGVRL
jgi:hypothetical protein